MSSRGELVELHNPAGLPGGNSSPLNYSLERAVLGGRSLEGFPCGRISGQTHYLWLAIGLAEQCVAGTLLLTSLPLLLLVGAVVTVLARREPLVAHRRVGIGGREIWVLKLRTMWDRSESFPFPRGVLEYLPDEPVPETKSDRDDRVTSRFALLCRKYSIDELPQLWQIARGQMALVGPRPLTSSELLKHYGEEAALLLKVKPGLTGLWQVRGRNRLTYRQRRKLDRFMLEKWSLALYLRILTGTVSGVLRGRDAY